MEEWIGIYKGLRLPIISVLFLLLVYYYFKPSNKEKYEDIRFTMLDDDLDPHLSEIARKNIKEKDLEKKGDQNLLKEDS